MFLFHVSVCMWDVKASFGKFSFMFLFSEWTIAFPVLRRD
jgi:hypothetical protein